MDLSQLPDASLPLTGNERTLVEQDGKSKKTTVSALGGGGGGSMTGAQILAALAPVDGAGSGLDSDFLDGQHGSYYLAYGNFTGVPSTFAPSAHSHPQSEVTNLVSDLAAKAPLASPALSGTPTSTTPSTSDNSTRIATTAMVQAALGAYIAAQDVLVFKGGIDASTNPNYPAADAGAVYKITVAGKVGGASGPNVEVGDTLTCTVDGSTAGNHATVGANWIISQVNIDGAVTGPASATDNNPTVYDGTSGRLVKQITYATFKTNLALVKGDVGLGNVDNTADSAKSVASAATLTTTRTIDGQNFNGSANITVIAPGTVAATAKTTPLDADLFPIADTAASNVLKKVTFANLKAFLKSYFDTLYTGLSGAFGQCILSWNGTSLQLKPRGGNLITINGAVMTVPDAGVSLTPSGLTNSTTYYVYAFNNAGNVDLVLSTTGHSTSTTAGNKGVEIETGNDARTLVGMARTISTSAFSDTASKRFVRSWFNDPGLPLTTSFLSSANTTSSATFVELSASARAEFLIWAGEVLDATCSGVISNSSTGSSYGAMGLDGTTPVGPEFATNPAIAGGRAPFSVNYVNTLSEGYHYLTVLGAALTAGNMFCYSASVGGTGTAISAKLKR